MTLVLALAVLAGILLLLLVVLGTLASRSRGGRGVELEPPPGPAPPGRPPVEVYPELAARVEEALAPSPEPGPDQTGARPLEAAPSGPVPDLAEALAALPEPVAPARPRLRDRMGKARALLGGHLGAVAGRTRIDEETWDHLEEALVMADVGVTRTAGILDRLRAKVRSGEIKTAEALLEALKVDLEQALAGGDRALHLEPGAANVWLFVGVNGVGKTTTIGKVGRREAAAGRSVVMAAGDTFRAAASEQLELWAHRVGADLVRGAEGGDPGSVVFDAVQRAAARQAELVLADTAGRLHTKVNLMEELKKIRRVAERPPGRLSEVLLVIDATTGQNGLVQARQFAEAVGVTGIVLTKLDGTAKGGIVLAIQGELGLPIKLVGVGETAEDLVDFDPGEFVDALFG